jgi:signal transduction histidine kinase
MMRSLVAKIFVCSLLIQILTRGVWVTLAPLFAVQHPGPARMLQHAMPLYANLAAETLERDGPAALAAFLAQAEQESAMKFELRQNPAACEPGHPSSGGPFSIAAETVRGQDRYCLTGTSTLPRLTPRWWPDGVLLIELALCAVFSFFLARYLLQPIRKLSHAAQALGRGDLTARAGPRLGRRRDEAGELVRQFDRMAERIALLIQSQQRFIGDVSHEIKSPLARLNMALGLARREVNGLAPARFDRMEYEVGTISALIRELLTLSTMQAADAADRTGLVDLVDLVRSVIEDAKFEWRERPADIRLTCEEAQVHVPGDATLLRRAFENVLRNALFYTPAGTAVNVVIRRAAGCVMLMVRDQGPGVPAGALDHLFDPFYRVDEARARNTGGVGIGLAICERAVRLHGGQVRAENVTPSGLSVTLELPCGADTVPA